jgi:hypothetical protein
MFESGHGPYQGFSIHKKVSLLVFEQLFKSEHGTWNALSLSLSFSLSPFETDVSSFLCDNFCVFPG